MATVTAVTRKNNLILIAAWVYMLLASVLPEILLHEVLHRPDLLAWMTWGRLVTLAALTIISWLWQPLRPLWRYAAILLIFAGGQELMNAMRDTVGWQSIVNPWAVLSRANIWACNCGNWATP